jgi:hypothetical protein
LSGVHGDGTGVKPVTWEHPKPRGRA